MHVMEKKLVQAAHTVQGRRECNELVKEGSSINARLNEVGRKSEIRHFAIFPDKEVSHSNGICLGG